MDIANLNAKIVDIRGGLDYITITYDNGYAVKAYGELMPGTSFRVYKKSIKSWQPPHEKEPMTNAMVKKIEADVLDSSGEGKVTINFQ